MSSALTNRFGPRVVCFLGGVCSGCAFAISMFAQNVYTLYVTFGALSGKNLQPCLPNNFFQMSIHLVRTSTFETTHGILNLPRTITCYLQPATMPHESPEPVKNHHLFLLVSDLFVLNLSSKHFIYCKNVSWQKSKSSYNNVSIYKTFHLIIHISY